MYLVPRSIPFVFIYFPTMRFIWSNLSNSKSLFTWNESWNTLLSVDVTNNQKLVCEFYNVFFIQQLIDFLNSSYNLCVFIFTHTRIVHTSHIKFVLIKYESNKRRLCLLCPLTTFMHCRFLLTTLNMNIYTRSIMPFKWKFPFSSLPLPLPLPLYQNLYKM